MGIYDTTRFYVRRRFCITVLCARLPLRFLAVQNILTTEKKENNEKTRGARGAPRASYSVFYYKIKHKPMYIAKEEGGNKKFST